MKRIIKLFPAFILLLLTILMIIYIDIDEKTNYNEFGEYHLIGFRINPENENIHSNTIDEVFHLAQEKDVLLVKEIFNETNNSTDLYISTNSLFKLYDSRCRVEKLREEADNSFIATFKTDDQRQSYYIPDFLDNDRFVFYSVEVMNENDIYRYGDYSLYYKDDSQLESFIHEVSIILNEPQEMLLNYHWGQLSSHIDLLLIAIIVCILFFILFFYLITVFQLYKESKKIGCLLLLGFRKIDITILMIKESIKYLVFSSLCYFLLCALFLSNISFYFIMTLSFLYVCMIMLTLLISYLSILIVCRYTKTSNILKKESLANKISKLLLFSKGIMTGTIILFLLSFIPIIKESYQSTQYLKDTKILMDYAVFPRIDVENQEYNESENYLTLFRSLEDFGIDYIYADFRNYLITDKISLETSERQEIAGETYRTASIDKNYLRKYSVEIFNTENSMINYDILDQEFFLLPYSKKGYYDAFYSYIERRYKRYNFDTEVKVYFYKDCAFHTYDATTGIQSVESPILRVIDKNYKFTYFENFTGLDIAGTGMKTALKINISTGKNQVFSKLEECLKNANLQDVLTKNNFVSYEDFYKDELTRLRKNNAAFILGISLLLIIYITLVTQTFILYMESKMNQVLVKILLGHERKNIFKNIIYLNIGLSFIVIISLMAYDITSGMQDFWIHFAVYLGFLLVDIVVLIMITNLIKLNKVYTKLKGE